MLSKGNLYLFLCFLINFVFLLWFPSSVQAIRATAGDGQIQVSWLAPNQNEDGSILTDLRGFNIYRSLSEKGETEKINPEPISGCAYIDTGLTNGKTYYYTVTAIDFSGNESVRSPMVFATPTVLPPAGFTAISDSHKIKLFWEKSANLDIRGYHLYRTLKPGQNYDKITMMPIEGIYFEDLQVENGVNYYYVITSVSADGFESPYSEERGATPVALIPSAPSSLKAKYENNKVRLEWEKDLKEENIEGYHVYRRNALEDKNFKKLTGQAITEAYRAEKNTQYFYYEDDTIEENTQYFYSVVSVYDGVESQFPLEVACYTKSLYIASVTEDTEGKAKKAGDQITITMTGEPGCHATFTIENLKENQPMEEISPGVYHQVFTVSGGNNISGTKLMGALSHEGLTNYRESAGKISIQNDPPPPIESISAQINGFGWPEIRWTSPPPETFAQVEIYRSTSATSPDVDLPATSLFSVKKSASVYVDQKAEAGALYYYMARTVDEAGNKSEFSKSVEVNLAQKTEGPTITSVSDDTLGITVKTDRIIHITAKGDLGCEAFFSIGEIVKEYHLKESELGSYKGQYTVKTTDQTEGAELIVKLVDQAGRARLAKGGNLIRMNIQSGDLEPPSIKSVEHNAGRIAGISGKLVEGDNLQVKLTGEPGGVAFFSPGQTGPKISMEESQLTPGEYFRSYIIRIGDDGEEINLHGHLTDQAGNTTTKPSDILLAIDTRPVITVTRGKELAALKEEKESLLKDPSHSEIYVKLENINGDPIRDHHLALTLTTTDEYTDVIGGGNFGGEIDGKLAVDYEGVTDNRGEVQATYTAGNAAKTAIILAKDLHTGCTGVGYITTYIESSLDILLLSRQKKKEIPAGPGDAVRMILSVKPAKITADGRSRAAITVNLFDSQNKPVEKPYKVTFSPSFDEGRVSPQTIYTNEKGEGYTYYEAGKKIGTMVITAIAMRKEDPDLAPQLTETAQIILMSDAPSKLILTAQTNSLWAGDSNPLEIFFKVTDINDNPNPEAAIQLSLLDENNRSSDNGRLSSSFLYTDRNGEAVCTYTAGWAGGLVRIRAKVSSRIPTEDEKRRVQGTLFVPLWPEEEGDNFGTFWAEKVNDEEIGTIEWLKSESDKITRGEVVARIKTESYGDISVKSPYDAARVDIRVRNGERVRVGQSIGFIEIEE